MTMTTAYLLSLALVAVLYETRVTAFGVPGSSPSAYTASSASIHTLSRLSCPSRYHRRRPSSTLQASSMPSRDVDWSKVGQQVVAETKEAAACLAMVASALFPSSAVTAADIVQVCDEIDQVVVNDDLLVTSKTLALRQRALEFQRYELLAKLLRDDYAAYVATAAFLSPSRIPRLALPNVQDVPYDKEREPVTEGAVDENGIPLVADCELQDLEFQPNVLDKVLLNVFRKFVTKNTGGVTSDTPGLTGLLEQGRTFMLQPGQTPQAQHKMVMDTLAGLMTPVLPPFYRIFMSGIVPPNLGTPWDGKQVGPWFYAPF